MTIGFSAFTTSRYYHPAFNSAIFDGPIRIYFVQFHESYALNIYFSIQERFAEALNHFKDIAKKMDQTLLIMIYPTEESFIKAFALTNPPDKILAKMEEEKESIFGLLAPITDSNVGQLMDELSDIFNKWELKSLAEVINTKSNNSIMDFRNESPKIKKDPVNEAI